MSKGKTALVIKVTTPKNQKGHEHAQMKIGSKKEVSAALLSTTTGRKQLARQGYMGLEDYETGKFALYGLEKVADELAKKKEVSSLQETNAALQNVVSDKDKEIAELKAQLAAKATGEDKEVAETSEEKPKKPGRKKTEEKQEGEGE